MPRLLPRIIAFSLVTGLAIGAWWLLVVRVGTVLEKDDQEAWKSYAKAVDFSRERRLEETEEALISAVRLALRDEPEFHRALGTFYFYTHRCREAVQQFERALELDSDLTAKLLNPAAWCWSELGETSKAAQIMLRLKTEYPDQFNYFDAEFLRSLQDQMKWKKRKDLCRVRFLFSLPSEKANNGPFFLAGNWSEKGSQNDVYGYVPVEMKSEKKNLFTHEVFLRYDADLPYVALIRNRQGHTVGYVRFLLSNHKAAGRVVQIPFAPPRPFYALRRTASFQPFRSGADGKKRVFVLWPDCGSWWMFRLLHEKGGSPNFSAMMKRGQYGEMISDPPLTSIAIQRLTSFIETPSWWSALWIQIKGLQVFDRFVSVDRGGANTLSSWFAQHKIQFVDWTFNQMFVISQNDSSTEHGFEREQHFHYQFEPTRTKISKDSIVRSYVAVDRIHPFVEKRNLYGKWLLATQWDDTEKKAQKALSYFDGKDRPQVMLVRLPAVDILSHYYFENSESPSERLQLLESFYIYLDDLIGRVRSVLDEDDVLLLISDHGIVNGYNHHPSSLFLAEGKGVGKPGPIPAFPIDRFPHLLSKLFHTGDGVPGEK